MQKRSFAVVIEQAGRNFSAYAPDLPGVIATGATRRKTIANMRRAIVLHLSALTEAHAALPEASTHVMRVAVNVGKPRASGRRIRRFPTKP